MKRYSPNDIEPKWQKIWDDTRVYETDLNSDKPKYIGMSMFNYPSGAGIHIGHAMNYTISDVKARYYRQQGYESYHPVGWDAFGLPAENYAIKTGVSPQESMAKIIPSYHHQYKAMGWSNDWHKEISTHKPEYYKWSQWIFAEMYRRGLVYQDSRMQWWCEKDNTVLANEQVINGKCWRHDGPDDPLVKQREIKQWFFKITDYADELLEATDSLDWTESVKLAQKNWIGKSLGAEIDFDISCDGDAPKPNFVILHGYKETANNHAMPWLKAELEQRGFKVQLPALPNPDYPKEKEQLDFVLKNCDINENTILVGHSLGGGLAMKVLEQVNVKVRKLILVAPVIETNYLLKHNKKAGRRYFDDTFNLSYDYDSIKDRAFSIDILSDSKEAEKRLSYLKYLSNKLSANLQECDAQKVHFTNEQEPFVLNALVPKVKVFTTRADTIFGATFLVLAPEHELVGPITTVEQERSVKEYIKKTMAKSELERQESKQKTGVFTGSYATNPASGEKIPIWIADYVLTGYGTGAIMAVPAHDERDNDFAIKFDLPVKKVITKDGNVSRHEENNSEIYSGEGTIVNSGVYDEIASSDARERIVHDLAKRGLAKEKINYKMRDWSVSRQRYWGAPIPIVYCKKCGPVLVPDKDLPVILPEIDDYKPASDGRSALARATDWLNVKCPDCGADGERETDTLDTYVDSSFYMLRYLDPFNSEKIFNSKVASKWAPIDFYNGGDHATAHLLYARFITRFLHNIGLLDTAEPFKTMLFNGKILASDGTMFSKSKGNGIDPLEIINQGYGADALRTYLMFAAPLEFGAKWDPQGAPGCFRFLNRLWNLAQEFIESKDDSVKPDENMLMKPLHRAIKKVSEDIEQSHYNTAIASAMELVNDLYKVKQKFPVNKTDLWKEAIQQTVALVAPFAPFMSEELWHELGHETSIHKDSWPKYEERYLIDDKITLVIQINSKVRAKIEVNKDASEEEVKEQALNQPKIKELLSGSEPKRVVYVKGRLVNIVAS